jgi:regulator of sigma E protease
MNLLHYIVAFLIVLGVLIVVHELGHYLAARLCGVKVLRFSVGMGKVVLSRRFGSDQTEWALSALPFGGYVKMLDAREDDLSNLSEEDLKREFTRQSVWRRIVIVAAGPVSNFLLAIAIFAGLYMYGVPEPSTTLRVVPEHTAAYQAGLRGGETITAINGEPVQAWSDLRWKLLQLALEKQPAMLSFSSKDHPGSSGTAELSLNGLSLKDMEGDFLGKVGLDILRSKAILKGLNPEGPAKKAGLQEGDEILQVNGKPIADGLSLIEVIQASPNKPLHMHVLRSGKQLDIDVTPVPEVLKDGRTIGLIKVEAQPMVVPAELIVVSNSLPTAIGKGVRHTWETSTLTLKMLGKMLVGEISWRNISGPIAIADYAGQTAKMGWISFISFIAAVSISLGVMNLLPIPVLDGGHLLYYSLEVLTGRPLPERVSELAQRAGLGLLMTLMVLALFNDVARRVPDFAAFFS